MLPTLPAIQKFLASGGVDPTLQGDDCLGAGRGWISRQSPKGAGSTDVPTENNRLGVAAGSLQSKFDGGFLQPIKTRHATFKARGTPDAFGTQA